MPCCTLIVNRIPTNRASCALILNGVLQAKRELARKLATIGADHAAEMSAAARRAATERKAAEHKAAAAEEALSVMEAAHHDAVQQIATLKAAHEGEMDMRIEAAENAQQEVLALQDQNVELTVRSALLHARSRSTPSPLSPLPPPRPPAPVCVSY